MTAMLATQPGAVRLIIKSLISKILFANTQCKVTFDAGSLGIFGYGSLAVAHAVRDYGKGGDDASLIADNYCDVARGVSILLGGEHDNRAIVNTPLAAFPLELHRLKQAKIEHSVVRSKGAVTLGGNVVLSLGCTLRSGVTVGDGAVIGANAMVTSTVEPFSITAGNPARHVKHRFDEATQEALLQTCWWELPPTLMFRYFADIQRLPAPDAVKRLRDFERPAPSRDYLVFKTRKQKTAEHFLDFLGVERNGVLTEAGDLPPLFKAYISQMEQMPGSEFTLLPDIFRLLD